MSAAGSSEEQFLCSICLEVFSEPVSTPCGHNFCKRCISQAWDSSESCFCPLCKEVFSIRPQLCVNTLFSEMVSQARLKKRRRSMEEQPFFTAQKAITMAIKTILILILICVVYTVLEHKNHTSVPLKEALSELETSLSLKFNKVLRELAESDKKELRELAESDKKELRELAESDKKELRELAESDKKELRELAESDKKELRELAESDKKELRELAESDKKELRELAESDKKELRELAESDKKELRELAESDKKELRELAESDKKELRELAESDKKELRELAELDKKELRELAELDKKELRELAELDKKELRELAELDKKELRELAELDKKELRELAELDKKELRELAELDKKELRELAELDKKELRRVQQFAVDVTLDPNTAAPWLVLSEDLKQVHHTDLRKKQLPDSPQRFAYYTIVLGKQSFSSGRFYFEVQVKGKTKWTLGVARESVNRKGKISLSPKNGFWTIWLRNRDKYKALDDPRVPLSPQRPPQKVGVFVDYEAGLVSFYDVDSGDLLFSFTNCSFREKLFPFFHPCLNEGGTNSAPLIISAVSSDRHRALSDPCVQTADGFWVTSAIVLSLILLLCALPLICHYFMFSNMKY